MTDKEAVELMEKDTFQEAEEATGKLQRAKLSSAQLPMYFLGEGAGIWIEGPGESRQKKLEGQSFQSPRFP